MTGVTPPAGGPADPVAAAAEAVLRGLAHQLGNRAGTIGAAAEALHAADPSSQYAALLADEARRLDELLRLLRLLPLDPARAPEPVRSADLMADALGLFALHARGRELTPEVQGLEDAPPVRVRGPAVSRALVVLLAAAAGPEGGAVRVRRGGTPTELAILVDGPGSADGRAAAAAPDVAAAAALVAPDEGRVAHEAAPGAFVLRLPTLTELRRRSGEVLAQR